MRADEWLKQYPDQFHGTPIPTEQVRAAAKAAGLTRTELKQGRQRLEVKTITFSDADNYRSFWVQAADVDRWGEVEVA